MGTGTAQAEDQNAEETEDIHQRQISELLKGTNLAKTEMGGNTPSRNTIKHGVFET